MISDLLRVGSPLFPFYFLIRNLREKNSGKSPMFCGLITLKRMPLTRTRKGISIERAGWIADWIQL